MERMILGKFFLSRVTVGNRIIQLFYYYLGAISNEETGISRANVKEFYFESVGN
jgi:hypothetical protein